MIRVEDCSGFYLYVWVQCECGYAWCDWMPLGHSPFDIASCEICCPRPPQTEPHEIQGCLMCRPQKLKMLVA